MKSFLNDELASKQRTVSGWISSSSPANSTVLQVLYNLHLVKGKEAVKLIGNMGASCERLVIDLMCLKTRVLWLSNNQDRRCKRRVSFEEEHWQTEELVNLIRLTSLLV
jgi:hypothetical protein